MNTTMITMPCGQTQTRTAVLTLPVSINGIIWRGLVRIRGYGQFFRGIRDISGGGKEDGREMEVSSHRNIVAAVSALGFKPHSAYGADIETETGTTTKQA